MPVGGRKTIICRSLTGLAILVLLIAIGLAIWEPLVARPGVAPPPHRCDTVIARDRWGVPHIFGRTDPDVAHAHAEDDFATLQDVIAMTRGRAGALASRSIQPFGAATTRPESPHDADQAALSASHRTKPVFFGPAALRANLERVYRP